MFRSAPLDGDRNDLAGFFVDRVFDLVFHGANPHGLFMHQFLVQPRQKQILGVFLTHGCDLLQPLLFLLDQINELFGFLLGGSFIFLQFCQPRVNIFFLALQKIDPLVQILFFLLDPFLRGQDLFPALFRFRFKILPQLDRQVFSLQFYFLFAPVCLQHGGINQGPGPVLGILKLLAGKKPPDKITSEKRNNKKKKHNDTARVYVKFIEHRPTPPLSNTPDNTSSFN